MGAADDGSGTGRPAATVADPRILGQLLACQTALPVLPTPQHIADFYAHALSSLPGAADGRVCLGACSSAHTPPFAEACQACDAARQGAAADPAEPPPAIVCPLATEPGIVTFPLATQQHRFGLFVLRVAAREVFEPYRPFVRNLGNALALFLENRLQQARLADARDVLERRVVERTEALTSTNRELAREVDERKRAEAAVRELNEELSRALAESEDLYENAPCGYHSLDEDGTYVRVNDTELRWLGRGREEVVGKLRFADVLTEESQGEFARAFSGLKATGVLLNEELELLRGDGETFPVLLSATAIRDGAGRFLRSRGTMNDLTEHRRAQRALHDSEERFRQSQKLEAIGRLAGGVAHDFNNLLTVILSCADALTDALPADDPRRVDADEIGDAARRASHLTRQLLAFSRRQASSPALLDVGEVLAGMEALLRRLIGEDVVLEVSRQPALGRVRVDPGQLEQVILNLAVNARDAMPEGGRLRIEAANLEVAAGDAGRPATAPGRYVALSVRDTGSGMSPEILSHLFEPFFTTKAKGQGTGLGLATVYGIVKQAGGEVRVESAPGAGTTFEVVLPRVDAGAAAAPTAGPDDGPVPRGQETVLLVEDDAHVRASGARALRAAGYTVVEAGDGEEALARAGAPGPLDVLVTDVVMPRLGGAALAARIRAARGPVPTLFVSGYAEEGLLRRELGDGVAQVLWKPFTAAGLARAVRAVLDATPAPPAPGATPPA